MQVGGEGEEFIGIRVTGIDLVAEDPKWYVSIRSRIHAVCFNWRSGTVWSADFIPYKLRLAQTQLHKVVVMNGGSDEVMCLKALENSSREGAMLPDVGTTGIGKDIVYDYPNLEQHLDTVCCGRRLCV
eukprot:scaffold2053_cov112-Cylindrotheca_fusiformis.AAC.7